MKPRFNNFIAAICLLAFISACGGGDPLPASQPKADATDGLALNSAPSDPNDPLVAEWKGGVLYLSQIDRFVGDHVWQAMDMVDAATKSIAMLAREREQVVNVLVGNYLLLLEAHEQNLTLSDAQREALLRTAKSKFPDEEAYQAFLSNSKQTEDDLINILHNVELGKFCVEQQQQKLAGQINQDTMKAFYEKNIDKFTPPHRTHLNRIDLHVKEDRNLEETREFAQRLHDEVAEKLKPLETLEEKRDVIREYARANSDSGDGKYNGGYVTLYHNELTEDAFSHEFMAAAKASEIGELSPLIPTKHGYGFLMVKEQFPSQRHELDSDVMQNMLPNMMIKESMDEWREELKTKFELNVHDEHFQRPPVLIPKTETSGVVPVNVPDYIE